MSAEWGQWGLDYELILVDDGSRDGTATLLDQAAASDRHIRAVHLTRNFGHQAAISAGLTVASGDVIAIMDCDLQDPPEVLPRFLSKWREGFQVVYAIRKSRKEWIGKRLAYWGFYRLLGAISDLDIPLDSGDFCLLDRSAVDLINSLPEQQRFVRGLRTWIGLKQVGVEYDRDLQGPWIAPTPPNDDILRLACWVAERAVKLRAVTVDVFSPTVSARQLQDSMQRTRAAFAVATAAAV